MSSEDNKAIVGRWFTDFWGADYNAAIIDELAHPDIRFEYSLHQPLRGRVAVRQFAADFRAAFPDLAFGGTADLIAEGDHVIGQSPRTEPTSAPAKSDHAGDSKFVAFSHHRRSLWTLPGRRPTRLRLHRSVWKPAGEPEYAQME